MDGEPSPLAQAKHIAECNDIDTAAIAGRADYLASGDGNCRVEKADSQVLKVHQGGRRLRRWTEAREPLLAVFDYASGIDADEVRSKEAAGLLRGLCVEPLVFYSPDGLGRSVVWRQPLRDCAEKRDCDQNEVEMAPSQILIKIFFR